MTSFDFELVTKDFDRKIQKLAKEHPSYIRSGAKAVNREVVKNTKKELAQRGYSPHKPMSFGDAGYLGISDKGEKNVSQNVFKDLSGKIYYASNYYHMRFIEYGANVKWRHKRGNFVLPARPSLHPKADEYWKTDKAVRIIERYLQNRYDKLTGGK